MLDAGAPLLARSEMTDLTCLGMNLQHEMLSTYHHDILVLLCDPDASISILKFILRIQLLYSFYTPRYDTQSMPRNDSPIEDR